MTSTNANPGIGDQLREARKAARLSQQKLAEKAHCSIAYIRLLEGGYAPNASVVLDRIEAVLTTAQTGQSRAHRGGVKTTGRGS